ncbi:MAG: NUDIX domain-containing protein [Patescibacteria group bacterium]|jgi:8-oxo-dGTP diphosphatase
MSPNPLKYKFAAIATDVVIFTLKQGELQVLLIKMKKQPFEKCWAAPGGLVKPMESVEAAARKQLALKTGVKNIYLEQLYTFGEVKRDPFGRVVSVAYFALIPSDSVTLHTTKEYADVRWFPVKKLPALAYDHAKIIDTAVRRLQSKMGYTNIVCNLLPKAFSLSELQGVYEIILNKHFDKRNFRKKILSLKLVKPMGKKREGEANRPAQLYTFANRLISQAEIM